MIPANDTHEPTPEFRARLAWQVETALRRETRFAEPVGGGGVRRFGTALIVVAALVVGGAAGIASEQVQDARARPARRERTLG